MAVSNLAAESPWTEGRLAAKGPGVLHQKLGRPDLETALPQFRLLAPPMTVVPEGSGHREIPMD
jgi:hypothetical protein